MQISLNEIKTQAPAFSKRWVDARDEAEQAELDVCSQFAKALLSDLYDFSKTAIAPHHHPTPTLTLRRLSHCQFF